MLNTLFRAVADLGPDASWIIRFLVVFFAALMAVFMWYVGKVLLALLDERDPDRQRILCKVLQDLLAVLCRRRGK